MCARRDIRNEKGSRLDREKRAKIAYISVVALNGLQVSFAQVIFQSIRDDDDDDDSGVADNVSHILLNKMQPEKKKFGNILLHVPQAIT